MTMAHSPSGTPNLSQQPHLQPQHHQQTQQTASASASPAMQSQHLPPPSVSTGPFPHAHGHAQHHNGASHDPMYRQQSQQQPQQHSHHLGEGHGQHPPHRGPIGQHNSPMHHQNMGGMQSRSASWNGQPPHHNHQQQMQDTRTQLFVSNLPFRVRWQDLKDLMRKCGTVLRADVALTPADGRSRGFGVVLFSRYEDAMKAIEVYHGFSWQTRILDVRIDSQDPRGEFALAEANRQTAMQQQAERYQLAMQQHQQQYGHLNNLGGGQPAGLIPPPPPPPLPLPMPGSASSSESPQLRTGDGPGSSPSPRLETVGSPRFMNGASTSSPAPSPRPSPAASASTPPSSTDEASLGPKAQRQDSASPIITLIQPPPPPPPPPPPSIFAAGPQGTMHGGLMQYYQQQQQHQQMRPGMAPGAGSNPNFGPSPVPAQYVGRHLFVGNLPFNCQWQELKDLMRQCGSVLRADIAEGPDGRSRGFGSVLFATAADAERAVHQLNGHEFNGRVLKVHFDKFSSASIPPPPPPPPPVGFGPHHGHHHPGPPPPLMQHHSSPDGPPGSGNPLLGPSYDPSRDLRDPRHIGQHLQQQYQQQQLHAQQSGQPSAFGFPPPMLQQAPLQDRFPDRAAMRLRDESAFGGERGQVGIGGSGAAGGNGGGSIMGVLHQAGAMPPPAQQHSMLQQQQQQQQQQARQAQQEEQTSHQSGQKATENVEPVKLSSDDQYIERGWADPEPEEEELKVDDEKIDEKQKPESDAAGEEDGDVVGTLAPSTASISGPSYASKPHHPSRISMPPPSSFPFTPGGGPLSPMTGGRLPPMTPSMPAFTLGAFPQTPPPMYPQGMFSPGLGPFSPQVGSPFFGPGQGMAWMNAAPGAPVHRQMSGEYNPMFPPMGQQQQPYYSMQPHYQQQPSHFGDYEGQQRRDGETANAEDADKTPPATPATGAPLTGGSSSALSMTSAGEPSYFPPVSNGSALRSDGEGSSSAPLSPSAVAGSSKFAHRPDLPHQSRSAEEATTLSNSAISTDSSPSPTASFAALKLNTASNAGAGWASSLTLGDTNGNGSNSIVSPRRKSFVPGLTSDSRGDRVIGDGDIRRRFEGDSSSSSLATAATAFGRAGLGGEGGASVGQIGGERILGGPGMEQIMARRASLDDPSVAMRLKPKFGSSIWGTN